MASNGNAPENAEDSTQKTSILPESQKEDLHKQPSKKRSKSTMRQKSRVEPVNTEPVLKEKYRKMFQKEKFFFTRSLRQKDEIIFIQKTFHQKECGHFISEKGQSGDGKSCLVKDLRCHCGEVLSRHAGIGVDANVSISDKFSIIPKEDKPQFERPNDKQSQTSSDESTKWEPHTSLIKSPTTAFGKIDFNGQQIQGRKPAKYVRISNDDRVEDVLQLMETFWDILKPEPPNLVISVVGGAKKFKLDGRSRTIFSRGLIKAAKTTKAWLITSGCNMGVMKAVGQVVTKGQSYNWDQDRPYHVLRCIGIVPWGYIKNRKCLESDGYGKFNAKYWSNTQIKPKQPVPLNSDHTHFILVDDGYRNKYGGVNKFRSKFEKLIAEKKGEGGLGIPVVLILVEGDINAILNVHASLSQEIPVVVCAGTGRAADILSYAYNHMSGYGSKNRTMSTTYQEELKKKIAEAYHKDDAIHGKLKDLVIDCCKREDLIVILNMMKHEELDLAILSVLLKAQTRASDKPTAENSPEFLESKLKLAMTWNRAEVAQDDIFKEDISWPSGILEQYLTDALIEGKIEFVKLLLNNGINMQEYLTSNCLEDLYKRSIRRHSYLDNIFMKASKQSNSETVTVKDIADFLKEMLDKYDDDMIVSEDKKPVFFQRPYKQLLIWAVLTNSINVAHLCLELGEEPITSALICTALCLGMERRVPKYHSSIRSDFARMKVEFEKLAISVLDECHDQKQDNAIKLVKRKSPAWSQMTYLQIAVSANDQKFVSSVACQNSIEKVWKKGIISSWRKVFLCAICPLLILWFDDISVNQKQSSKEKEKQSKMQKLLFFYRAPLTKFSLHAGAYVVFLALFTYMLSVDYQAKPSATEWVTFVWIVSFFIGMIHAFLVFPSPTFKGKLRDYFKILQILEFVNFLLAIIAFCVRWRYSWEGKIIYCVNAIIFYISIMKLYTANRTLGPKIYMFYKMMVELLKFIMVLVVFLLAYGVASQALLYRQRGSSWYVLKDIVYLPYWQLFGEIFLEDLETDETCTQAQLAAHGGSLGELDSTCRTFHWLVPVLLALYLLVGNVLLLNLLIAIFSHVFDTVEQNSIEIWKYQMYFLVMEFQKQSLLVPPLSLLFHLWHLLRWLYFKLSCQKRPKAEQFDKYRLEYLALFEKEMLANKLRPAKAHTMYSDDMRFSALQTRIDELTKLIEDEVQSGISHEPKEDKQETASPDVVKGSKPKSTPKKIKTDRQMSEASKGSIGKKRKIRQNTTSPGKSPLRHKGKNFSEDDNLHLEESLFTPQAHDPEPMSGTMSKPAPHHNSDDTDPIPLPPSPQKNFDVSIFHPTSEITTDRLNDKKPEHVSTSNTFYLDSTKYAGNLPSKTNDDLPPVELVKTDSREHKFQKSQGDSESENRSGGASPHLNRRKGHRLSNEF